MDWANRNIANKTGIQPSRAILKVDDISDPVLERFLAENKLVADREKMQLGKTGAYLKTFLQVAGSLGILFMVLAFIIFSMNFRLILAEAAADIKLLVELGYKHVSIGAHLVMFFGIFLIIILGLTGLVLLKSQPLILQVLGAQGSEESGIAFPFRTFFAGIVFTLGIFLFNILLIRKQLVKNL
jgi:hypothetical protein